MAPMTRPARSPQTIPHEAAWQAIASRDRRFDGKFVYGVASTGVFCRPSCPSRRPRRDRVTFFGTAADAQDAGYRPCRRCRPAGSPAQPLAAPPVERARAILDRSIDANVTLAHLGRLVGLSPSHLQRTFKAVVGVSPKEYARVRRLARLKAGLRKGKDVTTAIFEAGYGSGSRVYEESDRRLGMTPGAYGRGGEGMTIGYTIVDCTLGRLLVGATARGICAVRIGTTDRDLEASLRREFPRAEIALDAGRLAPWVRDIVRHLAGERRTLDLPLDVRATVFQWKVWEALTKIPLGSTQSYKDVAAAIGQPAAARAVARACATNPVAIVVPCHRVVRDDGSLGGYRWGVERKRRLLEQEHRLASRNQRAG